MTPFTCHVRFVLPALVTVAVNCCALPVKTFAVAGDRLTVGAGISVTVAVAIMDVSAAAAAVMVTVTVPEGLFVAGRYAVVGKVLGAVYSPVGEIVPKAPLPPTIEFTSQMIEVFDAFETLAEN